MEFSSHSRFCRSRKLQATGAQQGFKVTPFLPAGLCAEDAEMGSHSAKEPPSLETQDLLHHPAACLLQTAPDSQLQRALSPA